jgi:hypothetical protein
MPRCGGGGGLPTYIAIYSFHSSIRSIKRKFFAYRTSTWRRRRFLCACGRAAVATEEEVGIEVAVEETSSSGVDDGGEDWWSREWWSRERR